MEWFDIARILILLVEGSGIAGIAEHFASKPAAWAISCLERLKAIGFVRE